jgi:hypothetical protein
LCAGKYRFTCQVNDEREKVVGVKGWYKRRAGTLAIVFAVATVVLIVVVCFQAAMLHTEGWELQGGALLTLVGTLSGGVGAVALTQWSQRSQYRRQSSDQHRLEMRESIASVLDPSARLHDVQRLVRSAGEVNKDRAAEKWARGLPLPDSVLAFNEEFGTFVDEANHFRSQLRRALLVVDDDDLVDKLRALVTVGQEIVSHAESIFACAEAGETIDVSSLNRDLSKLGETTRLLADAAVARLKASGSRVYFS